MTTDKHLIEMARTLTDNAPQAIGAQSSLTDGVRELIRDLTNRLEQTTLPQTNREE